MKGWLEGLFEGDTLMKRSTERILTTHTGSLPRPADLTATLEALDAGTTPNPGWQYFVSFRASSTITSKG